MSFSESKALIEEGDTVILYIGVSQIYALEVKPKITNKLGQPVDNVFQTRYGSLKVMNLIGVKFGSKVSLSKGWAHVLYPTPELWTVTLPHRTQILYTPDISMVVTQLEIGPGSVVCEAGTGSGSLSHALLRAIGPTGRLYTCDFHKERVALDEFTHHGFGQRVTVSHRDVYVEGLGVENEADAVFLDLPRPWEALPHAVSSIKASGGRICSFSPCIEQVSRACELMASIGLQEITTLECLAREFQVKYISLPVLSNRKEAPENLQKNVLEEDLLESHKKRKFEDKPLEKSDICEDNCQTRRTDTEIEIKQENPSSSAGQQQNNDFRFKTGVTQLKMPGHTGFLTFATVPPGLRKVTLFPKTLSEDVSVL
ncbi:tRNA (adenine(58)-N(1))-methyltransferase catalytic subunit TRMT61A-like [Homarus americanus]|uniref:tRNA (adenine(58)-N(1))-methyltransferase catalytic subunit TRMT61A n=1 Tax=Homarus americanus TaxID=6706 RepID=A0A8J5MS89_HOMAM|nr:tRNA (adenine(58)-N(1))-methyltransferase catalytic subunit TRMT61A-like [Homarus americanus]